MLVIGHDGVETYVRAEGCAADLRGHRCGPALA